MLNKQWTHTSIPPLGLHGLLYGALYRLTVPHGIWHKKLKIFITFETFTMVLLKIHFF